MDQGICAEWPQPGPQLWQQIQGKMEEYLGDSIQRLRAVLETTFNSIIGGDLTRNSGQYSISSIGPLSDRALSQQWDFWQEHTR